MRIPDHLTCLLRNLYAGQETTVRTGHEEQTGSKLGKECVKAAYCHPAYLTYMQNIMRNGGLGETQAGIKIAGEISITSEMQMIPALWQKVKRN